MSCNENALFRVGVSLLTGMGWKLETTGGCSGETHLRSGAALSAAARAVVFRLEPASELPGQWARWSADDSASDSAGLGGDPRVCV